MSYIKENFTNEEAIHLTNEEVLLLNYLKTNLKDLTTIECIQLIPSKKNDNQNSIRINIIESSKLEEKQFLKQFVNNIKYSLDNRRTKSNNSFFITLSPPIETISQQEMKSLAKKEIVSSYIIFDRNGRYTNLQDYLKDYIVSFGGLISIDNIKQIELRKTKSSTEKKSR